MIILGIETSCDETACAILSFGSAQDGKERIQILSNVVASSAKLQEKFGGIIPEQAAREQIKSIIPVIEESLQVSGYRLQEIDAIAVTYGPGLIGSLLVGVETAKTLAQVWNKPLIPINHLIGHFYANWITSTSLRDHKVAKQSNKEIATSPTAPRNDKFEVPTFPCLGLLVSGGHTDLVLFTDHGKYQYLGGTRDDAAGECFDKCARLLGLPYPGGPHLSKLAEQGDPSKFRLPVPMTDSKDLDFSYSGLKTAVANIVKSFPVIASEQSERSNLTDKQIASSLESHLDFLPPRNDIMLANLAVSIEDTIVKSLIHKLTQALKKYPVDQIMVAGGVTANQKLANRLQVLGGSLKIKIHIPPPDLCTDNGAMIASAGFFVKPIKNPLDLQADPNLSL